MRAYAIGDVHGCLPQLDALLAAIEAEAASAPPRVSYVVFLGDLVDRGPDSKGVVERLRCWRPATLRPIFLKGNHEEFLLRALAGELGVLIPWLENGGDACVASYGLDPRRLVALEEADAIDRLRSAVPGAHRDFLEGFIDTFRFGDYLFVHAGIQPGIRLERQSPSDLRWIREPFLDDVSDHGFVVVHGHTVVATPEERTNRIGVDTGAYQGGPLTALALEDANRRFLQAHADGRVTRAA